MTEKNKVVGHYVDGGPVVVGEDEPVSSLKSAWFNGGDLADAVDQFRGRLARGMEFEAFRHEIQQTPVVERVDDRIILRGIDGLPITLVLEPKRVTVEEHEHKSSRIRVVTHKIEATGSTVVEAVVHGVGDELSVAQSRTLQVLKSFVQPVVKKGIMFAVKMRTFSSSDDSSSEVVLNVRGKSVNKGGESFIKLFNSEEEIKKVVGDGAVEIVEVKMYGDNIDGSIAEIHKSLEEFEEHLSHQTLDRTEIELSELRNLVDLYNRMLESERTRMEDMLNRAEQMYIDAIIKEKQNE